MLLFFRRLSNQLDPFDRLHAVLFACLRLFRHRRVRGIVHSRRAGGAFDHRSNQGVEVQDVGLAVLGSKLFRKRNRNHAGEFGLVRHIFHGKDRFGYRGFRRGRVFRRFGFFACNRSPDIDRYGSAQFRCRDDFIGDGERGKRVGRIGQKIALRTQARGDAVQGGEARRMAL